MQAQGHASRSGSSESITMVPSTHGVQLALHHFGGKGPKLIIAHATGFNALAYRPLLHALTASFDVWAMDFRGHGSSTAPIGADSDLYAWSNFADDLLCVVDHLGGEPVLAFGHSMGATSIMLAEQKRPGTIAAGWLFEPIVFPDDPGPRNTRMADGARKRRAVFESREHALARYASRPPLGTWRADALAGYVAGGFVDLADGTVRLACEPETEAAIFSGAYTMLDDVNMLTAPMVIASGLTSTEVSPSDWAPEIANGLVNGSHRRYDALTHFGPFQDPAMVGRDAVSFLNQHAG